MGSGSSTSFQPQHVYAVEESTTNGKSALAGFFIVDKVRNPLGRGSFVEGMVFWKRLHDAPEDQYVKAGCSGEVTYRTTKDGTSEATIQCQVRDKYELEHTCVAHAGKPYTVESLPEDATEINRYFVREDFVKDKTYRWDFENLRF